MKQFYRKSKTIVQLTRTKTLKPNQIYRAFGEKKIVKLNNFIIIINSILVMRIQ